VALELIPSASRLYVLGACFGVTWLEVNYRLDVVKGYTGWIHSERGQGELRLLLQWAPEKVPELLRDAAKAQHKQGKEEMDRVREEVTSHLATGGDEILELRSMVRKSGEVIPHNLGTERLIVIASSFCRSLCHFRS
jgi:hypothetical protein